LGLYFLALAVPNVSQRTALTAFSAGTIVTCCVVFGTPVHWLWYTLVGSGTIFIVGVVLSKLFDRDTSTIQP
jgi:hypothetical protein